MRKISAPISLAGSQLGQPRHVCAFFNGDEEEYRVLLPFIQDGCERGDKAIHVVNPHYFQIVLRIEPNEMFWQGRRLNKEEPPHVLRRKLLIGLSTHRQRWSDVHETNLF
jgi:hypothetical protein